MGRIARLVLIGRFRFRLLLDGVLDVIRRMGELPHAGAQGASAVLQHVRSQTLHLRESLYPWQRNKKTIPVRMPLEK